MTKLHLLKNYNNYYNRQLKKKTTVSEYISDSSIFITTIKNVNFDIRDGLFTEAIISYASVSATPNYVLVEEGTETEGVWTSSGFTRWFVIEAKQTRGLQFKLALKRDVIADHWDVIKASDCIIQKGYVGNDSVLAFNKEQQNFNKVKSDELLIKDETQSGYVVGFIERDADSANIIDATYSAQLSIDFDYSALPTSITDYMAIGSGTPNSKVEALTNDSKDSILMSADITAYWPKDATEHRAYYKGKVYESSAYSGRNAFANAPSTADIVTKYCTVDRTITSIMDTPPTLDNLTVYLKGISQFDYSLVNNYTSNFMETYSKKWKTKLSSLSLNWWSYCLNLDSGKLSTLEAYNNKVCEISGVYYRCEITRGTSTNKSVNVNSLSYGESMATVLRNNLPTSSDMDDWYYNPSYPTNHTPSNVEATDFNVYYKTQQVYIKLVQINEKVWTKITDSASRLHLIDAPYDMFVIPFSNDLEYEYNATTYTANKAMALNLAIEMCRELGATGSYDLQIVPFCPIRNEGTLASTFDMSLCNVEPIYQGTNHDNTDTVIGYYMWAEKSSDSFTLVENRDKLTLSGSELTYKQITQLNQYILCSPDKSAQWEFNPAMNRGINEWQISFDYRPYSSYVKIQPTWDYLYGNEKYNNLTDTRGLIFNGSYSVTQLNDNWATYVSQNKNYQAIFDTQISTQLKQYELQNKAAWDTLIPRSIGWGFVGPAMKTYYNIKEQELTESLQNVSLESQRKLFNYQLDNIQSQPKTISKLTSVNSDFRIFPFVEFYTTTEDEITLYNKNIQWNGMTVMAVGRIEQYLQANTETFIQATLLRYNEAIMIENDFTMVEEINAELNKGIYITKEE